MNQVHKQLGRVRASRRLTQHELAVRLQLLGWSQCDRFTISKIELDTRRVTDIELAWLATALEVTADELLGLER